jgi:hypothetical protein
VSTNVRLKFSVICLPGHGDVGVFSKWSLETYLGMHSTNLLSYTHTLPYTLENLPCKTEKICGKSKVTDFTFENYFYIAKHDISVARSCGGHEKQIFKAKPSRFTDMNNIRENNVMFDTVDIVSAVGMCAKRTVAKVTLFDLFLVMDAIMCEQNFGLEYSVICLGG